jgi:hypothetical protein
VVKKGEKCWKERMKSEESSEKTEKRDRLNERKSWGKIQTDSLRRKGEKEKRRKGEKEKRRKGEKEKRRKGEKEKW